MQQPNIKLCCFSASGVWSSSNLESKLNWRRFLLHLELLQVPLEAPHSIFLAFSLCCKNVKKLHFLSQRGKLKLFSQKSESKFMRPSRKTKKIMLTWHNAGTYTHACGIGGLLTSPNDSPEYNCVLETTHFVLEKINQLQSWPSWPIVQLKSPKNSFYLHPCVNLLLVRP